jgi:hypothetical protein
MDDQVEHALRVVAQTGRARQEILDADWLPLASAGTLLVQQGVDPGPVRRGRGFV